MTVIYSCWKPRSFACATKRKRFIAILRPSAIRQARSWAKPARSHASKASMKSTPRNSSNSSAKKCVSARLNTRPSSMPPASSVFTWERTRPSAKITSWITSSSPSKTSHAPSPTPLLGDAVKQRNRLNRKVPLRRVAESGGLAVCAFLLLWGPRAAAWHSALYPSDWQPPAGSISFETNKLIQDFSYAGYQAGEQPLPNLAGPVFDVTQAPYNADRTGTNDATAAIQSAINAAQAAGGGVGFLPAGLYSVRPQAANTYALQITASTVILRGAGIEGTFLLNTSTNMRSKSIILINGPSAAGFYASGVGSAGISQDLLGPTAQIPVTNASGFAPGQWVAVRADCTDAWISEHNETNWLGYGSHLQGGAYFRKVVAVSSVSKTITINAPTRYYLKIRDNPRVVRLSSAPLLACGLENFSIGNVQHGGGGWGENDYTIAGTGAYDG